MRKSPILQALGRHPALARLGVVVLMFIVWEIAARWFIDHELPVADHAARVLETMDPILLELRPMHF